MLLADGQVRLVYGEVDVAAADLLARQPRAPVVRLRREQVRLMARVDVLGQVASVDGLLGLSAGARLNIRFRVRVRVRVTVAVRVSARVTVG